MPDVFLAEAEPRRSPGIERHKEAGLFARQSAGLVRSISS